MLTIKGKYFPLELLNLRTNEKETYTLKECAELIESIRMQEGEEEKQKRDQEGQKESQKENLAPVQETDEREQGAQAGERSESSVPDPVITDKKAKEPQSEKRQTIAEEEKGEERQMEVEDYPELLPEGYTPTAYIKCHDGSEVEEKEWREAKALIDKLYEDTAMENWNLEEVYRKATKLVIILEKLHKES